MSRRALRVAATLVVTGLCTAYIVWKIDLGRTAHVLAHAAPGWWLASVAIMVGSVWPMAWRWQRLLAARGVHDSLSWLVRAYFVGYAAGQVLPTSLGGDASRIYETSRRHEGAGGAAAGTVLLERALGGTATLVLAAVGFALAVGNYDLGGYLWVELAFVVVAVLTGLTLFSTRLQPLLQLLRPLLRALRVERPLREVYIALHSFRANARLLVAMFALTLVVQAVRVLAIWCAGKAVGVELSPRPYYVMGPLLFLVMLVPFTVNGLAVRESFFVSFLGTLGISADHAFATGFLFFVVTVALALPGAAIVAWEALRGGARAPVPR
ncbi:MAG TPA: lysylphosphatidylglycerol synthase transmembrane domain-containing protein [Gaiellaceae bacterium]|nr:lysylphosphatidylglycerol synthase transmembrane domain-containing protein [Gaiellaceae bacterium]